MARKYKFEYFEQRPLNLSWLHSIRSQEELLIGKKRVFHLYGEGIAVGQPLGQPFHLGEFITEEVAEGVHFARVEVHIGAGRRIYSDRLLIDRAIQDGTFFRNEAFLWAMRGAKIDGKSLHLMGIVSFFSSHGSLDHLRALFKLAKQESMENLYHHAMLGRRGERKESGARYLETIERELENLLLGKVVSVIGRYWSLDREENWDRVEKTYRMLVHGEGKPVSQNTK